MFRPLNFFLDVPSQGPQPWGPRQRVPSSDLQGSPGWVFCGGPLERVPWRRSDGGELEGVSLQWIHWTRFPGGSSVAVVPWRRTTVESFLSGDFWVGSLA